MEVGPTTHYIMGGVRVDGDTQMSQGAGPVRLRRMRRRHQRRQSPGRQLAVRSARLRQARRRIRRASTPRKTLGAGNSRRSGRGRRRDWALGSFDARKATRGPVQDSAGSAGDDAGPGRHRPQRRGNAEGPRGAGKLEGACRRAQGRSATASTTRAGTPHRSAQPADRVRSGHALRPSSAKKAAAATSATTIPTRSAKFGKVNLVTWQGPATAKCKWKQATDPRRCRRS